MVLDKDYLKKKYVRNAAAPIPKLISQSILAPPSDSDSSGTEYTYSTSAIASSETVSLTPQDTLSMVSSPWSTESWYTSGTTEEELISESFLSWLSTDNTSLSLAPATTTSYGASTAFNSKNSSKKTLTLLKSVTSTGESLQIQPLANRKSEVSGSVSTWTMETYTSTGILSDASILRVRYPWSPCTIAMSGSELYPSTIESYESRKVSRVSVSGSLKERDSMTPMNYTLHGKQDKEPVVDWLLMKLNGLGMVRVRV